MMSDEAVREAFDKWKRARGVLMEVENAVELKRYDQALELIKAGLTETRSSRNWKGGYFELRDIALGESDPPDAA